MNRLKNDERILEEKLQNERMVEAPHLKVIRLIFIIQVEFLLEDGEWVSNEEVSDVLSQRLVNPC